MVTRIGFTGGRDYSDAATFVGSVLDIFEQRNLSQSNVFLVIGCARGADAMARTLAKSMELPHEVFRADWQTHGKRAGLLRNADMLDSGIDLLIACPGGNGTAHMKRICQAANVEIIEIQGKNK